MGYDERDNYNPNTRQRDLVLATNEYVYVQSLTSGQIKTYTGPQTLTISQQESLVIFDPNSKKFKEISDFEKAKRLFMSAPENWYMILKNPAPDNKHPEPGKAGVVDSLRVGQKVVVTGPCTFALWPGQMAKVVRGHALRTNQYLLARVYEAAAASSSTGEVRNAEGEVISTKQTYVNGQILVIKGTEVSFYIPPTGIEVIPINNDDVLGYIRDAVTLERLEYCILKDEDGNKRYVHGPAVVFPKATETFVTAPKGGYIFRAIELSPISGIYVKVIAPEYKIDENGQETTEILHNIGEELFITGNDQMIYYPRPEHAIISYDGKIMHHAIAIPEGEGRYIMDRLTGAIKTVKGPQMYLPDPRFEVVVKRKLSTRQCNLFYPGNKEALAYNEGLSEKIVEKRNKNFTSLDSLTAFSVANSINDTLANLESNANISRGTSYTKPRTITLDTKYEGVVTIDVWTGYAVNVISKDGKREVVCGPQTVMLDYDQTLEELQLSTGKPKNTDNLIHTVFLRHENNKVSDIITVETKDFVECQVKVSYCINFDPNYKNNWFNVDDYVKFVTDRERSLMKRAVKNYTIEEFYQNYGTIIHDVAIGLDVPVEKDETRGYKGRFFPENGMCVSDCEVLSIHIDNDVYDLIIEHQKEMIEKALELSTADERVKVIEKLAIAETKENELENKKLINRLTLQREEALKKLEIQSEVNRKKEIEAEAVKQAEKDLQIMVDAIADAERARKQKDIDQELARKNAEAELEEAKQKAYAETVAKIMSSIAPGLIEALTANANRGMVDSLEHAVAPYVVAGDGETITDVVTRLTKGLPIEDAINKLANKE